MLGGRFSPPTPAFGYFQFHCINLTFGCPLDAGELFVCIWGGLLRMREAKHGGVFSLDFVCVECFSYV